MKLPLIFRLLFLLFSLCSCQGKIIVKYPDLNFDELNFDSTITQGTFFAGSLIGLDLNVKGSDFINSTPLTYSCYVDHTIDQTVGEITDCSTIAGLSFNNTTGELSWSPTAAQFGPYEFKVTGIAGDKSINSLFSFEVKNRAPLLDIIADQVAAEDSAITVVDAADHGTDVDSDEQPLSYSCYYDTTVDGAVVNTALCTSLGATFNNSTGQMLWTPSFGQAGTYEFKVIGSDGSLSDDEIFVITVATVNNQPSIDPIADQSATSGYAITPINAGDGGDDLDDDGDTLTYTCYYDNSFDSSVTTTDDCSIIGVAFNSSTGSFTWTPSYIQRGDFEFKIIASDGSLADETIFQIDVTTIQFVAMYNITANGGSMTLPLISGYNYNFTVNWGDGSTSSVTAWDDTDKTHTYATAGDYIVAIEGTMEALNYPSACNLKRVYNLGYMNWKSMVYAFETNKLIGFVAGDTDTSQITDLQWTFDSTSNLVSADFTGFNTTSVTNMEGMFFGTGLTDLDLTSFDTRNVINMREMFEGSDIVNLDVSSFRNNSATDMYAMFGYAVNLTNINMTGFTTPLVTDMSHMFANINATSLDLSSFDTSHVTTFGSMFKWSDGLQSINLSSFNTSNATVISQMFLGCYALPSVDVSNFDTSNATTMSEMFRDCSSLTSLDLSNFNTSGVTNLSHMFYGASNLAYLNLNGWDITLLPISTDIFYNVTNITAALYCDQGGSPGTGTMFGVTCN